MLQRSSHFSNIEAQPVCDLYHVGRLDGGSDVMDKIKNIKLSYDQTWMDLYLLLYESV